MMSVEADIEQQARKEGASKIMLKLLSMIKDERSAREQAQLALYNRVVAGEALGAERGDSDRVVAARLAEVGEDIADLRAHVRLGETFAALSERAASKVLMNSEGVWQSSSWH